jgi:hypothetical protein
MNFEQGDDGPKSAAIAKAVVDTVAAGAEDSAYLLAQLNSLPVLTSCDGPVGAETIEILNDGAGALSTQPQKETDFASIQSQSHCGKNPHYKITWAVKRRR